MSAVNETLALSLMKTQLNRLTADTTLDAYFQARISAAIGEIENTGIILTDSTADLMLVVDLAVWRYQNRDKSGAIPPDIRLRCLNRWVQGKGGET